MTVGIIGLIVFPLMIFTGCNTVAPKQTPAKIISFDGNQQDAGVRGFATNGIIVTLGFRQRYNALIPVYGQFFSPRLQVDDGFSLYTNGTYVIDSEHFTDFATMSAWKRSGLSGQ